MFAFLRTYIIRFYLPTCLHRDQFRPSHLSISEGAYFIRKQRQIGRKPSIKYCLRARFLKSLVYSLHRGTQWAEVQPFQLGPPIHRQAVISCEWNGKKLNSGTSEYTWKLLVCFFLSFFLPLPATMPWANRVCGLKTELHVLVLYFFLPFQKHLVLLVYSAVLKLPPFPDSV